MLFRHRPKGFVATEGRSRLVASNLGTGAYNGCTDPSQEFRKLLDAVEALSQCPT